MNEITESEIQAFIESEAAKWKPLPDSIYAGVPSDLADVMRASDREQLTVALGELKTVLSECRDKNVFAIQYAACMGEYAETMLEFLNNPRGETKEIQRASINLVKNGLHNKLLALQRWFHLVFTDTPIGEMPDQEILAIVSEDDIISTLPAHASSPRATEPEASEPTSGIGAMIGIGVGFLFLLWLCSGGASGNRGTQSGQQDRIDMQWDEYDARMNNIDRGN